MRNLRDEARWIIGEIDEAKRLAKAVGKPQLGTSSIEAGRVEEYDQDGALVQIIGEQYDGTHAPVTVNGPTPPEPAGLSLTVGVGSVEARWNGKFAGDAVSPMDFSHVSLHGSRPEVFTPSNDTQLATIAGELGDVATVILEPGEWTFGLVTVSKAGKWSELSETVTVEIPDYPDPVDIQDELILLDEKYDGVITEAGSLGNRLDQAEQELTAHEGRLEQAETDVDTALSGDVDVDRLAIGNGVIRDLVAQHIAGQTAAFQQVDVKNLFVTTGTMTEAVINRLFTDVVMSRKITTQMLAIGDFNNYIATGLGVNNEAIDWASGLTPDFEDVPSGISHSFKTTVGQGTKASTATKFDVNPGEEFVFEVWVKADKPDSRIFIEMRDQNGAHGVTSTMLSEDDNFVGNASYPVQNAVVPTVWTRWRARCIPKPGVRQVYIASIYFNHPNGTEKNAQVWLAGLSFRKRFGGEVVLDGSMKARHIDVVDLASDNGFIADLTSKIVKSDVFQGKEFFGGTFVGANFWTSPLAGVGMKIDDQGLRAYGPEGGEPVAEIRPDGGTVYQVSNPTTGEVLGGIDSEGNGTFQELRAADARFDGAVVIGGDALHDSAYGVNTPGDLGPVILGRSLIGTGFQEYFDSHPRVTDRTSWLDALPFGLVARGYRDITGTAITNREQEVLELRYPGNSSRGYKITVLPWSVYHQGGSYLALNIYRTTDGTRPTMRDEDRFIRKIIKNETSNYLMRDLGGTFYDLANSTGIVRYLFTFEATDGRAQVFDFSGGGFRVFVEDMGLLVSDSGVNRTGSRANAGSTPAPSNPPEPDPVKSYTDTISASWWQAYTGDNSQATHSTYSGAAAQGRTPYAPGNGVMRGLVGFPSQASRLSGATVKKIEVYVYAKSWHASAGGTAVLGVHGHGSKPGSFSATTNDVKRQKLKRPEGRWITLPSSVHAGFKSGSLRGISFYPPSGSTSTEYYGIFTGNKTKLRITYDK